MADSGAHSNRRPLLALVLLSPVLAEMLSGSTPPLEWLNPIAVLFLIWLYGAGVLVMRETAVRWKTGWPSILLLGAAYGITRSEEHTSELQSPSPNARSLTT